MKKSDLKDGMVVKLRDGEKFLVMNNRLLNKEKWGCISNYNDDLTDKCIRELDIMNVYNTNGLCLDDIFCDEVLEPVWEREKETSIDKLIKLFNNDCRYKNKTNECGDFETCSKCKATFLIEHIEEILDLIDTTYIKL